MEKGRKKISILLLLAEFGVIAFGCAGVLLTGRVLQISAYELLADLVMTAAGLAITGFQLRQAYIREELDYNNGKHPFRFWLCMCVGLGIAFICSFLPFGAWPFLTVFVMTSLFSNMGTGILSSSVLLLIPLMMSGAGFPYFVLYFVSGCFAVTLFRHLEDDFKIGIPLFLSVLCLLLCETAAVVLPADARPDVEMFLIPAANIIISSILLLGCLKLFSSAVIYRYRVNYLEINDTENPVLVRFKERSRDEYFLCIHTAHFCELIGQKIGADTDILKCAAYYHRLGAELPALMNEQKFPPGGREILTEYLSRKPPKHKETAILSCADLVVSSVTKLLRQEGNKPVDYEALVDSVFRKLAEDGWFWQCDISMREFEIMHRIFREEKLYYDFLR